MAKKLKANRFGKYVSKKGNLTFKYIVSGEESQLDEYKEAQGLNFREYLNEEDEKDPLNGMPIYFTTRALPKEIELEITTNGNVIVYESDDDAASKVLEEEQLIIQELAKLKAGERFNRNKVSK